jgi:biopolymer transport protein ExbD
MSPAAVVSSWRVRHEGSPKSIDNLTLQEVAEGLQEGQWQTTDEVRGPDDPNWVPIESHPLLEEVAAEIDAPPPRPYDDESRLDMTALIDVCLVLLVFFILTTTYAVLSKKLDGPIVSGDDPGKLKVVFKEKAEESMVMVDVSLKDGAVVYRVHKKEVPAERLEEELALAKGRQKTDLLLSHDADVPHGAVVRVQDAAAAPGVRIRQVLIAVPKQ